MSAYCSVARCVLVPLRSSALVSHKMVLFRFKDGAVFYEVPDVLELVVLHFTAVGSGHLHVEHAIGLELKRCKRLPTYMVCTMYRMSSNPKFRFS